MRRFLLGPCALAVITVASAAEAETVREPIGKWVLDYGETHCTASRAYGPKEKPATLAFRPSPNDSVMRVMVVRPGRRAFPYHFPVALRFSPGEAKGSGLRFKSSNNKFDILWINVPRPALGGLAATAELQVHGRGEISERFAVPADYPRQAANEEAEGTSRITMMIDEKGVMKDCMIEETSGIASLDAMACGVLLERAKFTPALDAQAKPARSVLTTRVTWRVGV
jgi:TonB family protein